MTTKTKPMTKTQFKKKRIDLKLTQDQYATVLFVTERMINYIESGERAVSKRMKNLVEELNSEIGPAKSFSIEDLLIMYKM